MNSNDNNTGKYVLGVLNDIANTAGKNDKKSLIKAAGGSELFMAVLTAAYDPFVNYGMRNVVMLETEHGTIDLSEDGPWGVLKALKERRLTGNEAISVVNTTLMALEPYSAEVFRRIINKDLRAGFSEGTINEVFKGTFPEFPYMRCTLPEKSNMGTWEWERGIYSQLKSDGMFVNVNHDTTGYVWITSRQGQQFPDNALANIVEEVRAKLDAGTQTHGELLVVDAVDGEILQRQIGNGMLNSVMQGGSLPEGHYAVLHVWDQIPLSVVKPKGSYSVPYSARFEDLIEQVSSCKHIAPIEYTVVYSKADAFAHYRQMLARKLEGTVVKSPGMLWRDTGSGGNKDQVKMKQVAEFELRIIGFNPGSPGTKTAETFGSLQCASECGRLEAGVSGITDALREEIHKNRDKFLMRVVTVKANGVMEPTEDGGLHSLFLPRLSEVRYDKSVADTLGYIRDIFEVTAEVA